MGPSPVGSATSEWARFSDLVLELRLEDEAKCEVALIGTKNQVNAVVVELRKKFSKFSVGSWCGRVKNYFGESGIQLSDFYHRGTNSSRRNFGTISLNGENSEVAYSFFDNAYTIPFEYDELQSKTHSFVNTSY